MCKSQNVSLYAQNVNNLFDSPDFWCMRLSPLFSETTHALTVAKCTVFMLSFYGLIPQL